MAIFIFLILFLSVNCEEVKPKCKQIIKYANNNTDVTDVQEACKSKPCVTKCCDIDHYLYFNKKSGLKECLHKDEFKQHLDVSQINFGFSDYPIYKSVEERNKTKSDKDFFKDYIVLVNKVFEEENCSQPITYSTTRMLENGRIYKLEFEIENLPTEYCVEKIIYKSIKTNLTRYRYTAFDIVDEDNFNQSSAVFVSVALLISAFFMGLVLLVYSILKQLRNIQGMILMGYIATFLVAYVLLAAISFGTLYGTFGNKECKYVSLFYYGFILSIFFWMNVMSFDIWWTFRATRKIRPIHRQGELMKFMWYGLYAWGTPAAIAITVFLTDKVDGLTKTTIFEMCLNNNKARLYLFMPILIMTVINTLLFLMTIYNLWLIKRAITDFEQPIRGKIKMNRNRFWLYIKVSLLMGVSWILELINWLFEDDISDWLSNLMNSPNLFMGVAIFIVFVCKKSIFSKLYKKCKNNNKMSISIRKNTENSENVLTKTTNTKSTG